MAENMNKEGMQTKQKIMIGIIVVVFLIIAWQLKGMFFSNPQTIVPAPQQTGNVNSAAGFAPKTVAATPPGSIKEGQLPQRDAAMTEGEKRLLALQMQTEAKYIAAMNELQLLRVQSEIAKNSKDIAQNRLDAVTAQKQTLQLLSAPQATVATYAQGLSAGATPQAPSNAPPAEVATPHVQYVVVSVSQLQHRWSAVLGYQGQLYNVVVGDVLSADGSKVIAIDRYGVTLDHNGTKQRVSLVSLI